MKDNQEPQEAKEAQEAQTDTQISGLLIVQFML